MLFSEVVAGIELDEQTHGSCEITGVEYDSRRVREGSLFVAMRGGTTDGNKFIRQAMDKGAGGVLTDSRESFTNALSRWPHLCIGLMEHGRRALATASANFFGHPEQKLKLTAVTGTNGKTTTTFLVEAMLQAASRKSVLVGTIEVHLAGEVRESPHTTPEARDLLKQGRLLGGTLDTWLIWKLTQGAAFVTDVSTASRTLLFNIHTLEWDQVLLDLFGIPREILADVRPSAGEFGIVLQPDLLCMGVPIVASLVDQPAAMIGQGCLQPGQTPRPSRRTWWPWTNPLFSTGSVPYSRAE